MEGNTNLRGRESVETYCKCKNWPNMSLFITRVLLVCYLLSYSFIKMNFILLPIKWINKTSFLFSENIIYFMCLKTNILINKNISSYLFNYNNIIIFLKLYLFLNKILFNLFYGKRMLHLAKNSTCLTDLLKPFSCCSTSLLDQVVSE